MYTVIMLRYSIHAAKLKVRSIGYWIDTRNSISGTDQLPPSLKEIYVVFPALHLSHIQIVVQEGH